MAVFFFLNFWIDTLNLMAIHPPEGTPTVFLSTGSMRLNDLGVVVTDSASNDEEIKSMEMNRVVFWDDDPGCGWHYECDIVNAGHCPASIPSFAGGTRVDPKANCEEKVMINGQWNSCR
ncbi:hypothetical protein SDJN02_11424, partial [Cucurbita argyrosperma subsp. argyrosperma]